MVQLIGCFFVCGFRHTHKIFLANILVHEEPNKKKKNNNNIIIHAIESFEAFDRISSIAERWNYLKSCTYL